jgi:spoIIIJ-associated protein
VISGEPEASGWVEVTAKTVSEATEAGLERLGLSSADEAVIEVVDEPQRGLLGVIGARGARIRLRPRKDRAEALETLVHDILGALGLARTEMRISREGDGYIRISLEGEGLGVLIGRRGETLDALQYLLNLASARMPLPVERVILDAGGYRERRRQTLERLAERIAERVRRTGEEVVLEPMTPQERKVVHLAITGEPGVRSESRGQEPFRRVVVCPVEDESD